MATTRRAAVRKPTKAERQAAHAAAIRSTKPVIAQIPPDDDEPSIDDLLGEEVPKISKTNPAQPTYKLKSEPRAHKGIMVSFTNKAGTRITAPGQKYMVVRDMKTGKLHYKELSQCILLPEDWQEGDPIPGFEETEKPNHSDAVEVESLEEGQQLLNSQEDEDDDLLG